jgi:DNA topoisomerase-3
VTVQNRGVEVQEDQTKPPPRVTEARILSLMENAGRAVDDEQLAQALHEKGIGTPATRADIIENLIRKGYVVRQGKALRPTVKGIRLVDVLRRMHADRLASPELTGDMEYRLREVERGNRTAREFMKEMAEYTTHVVDRARDFDYDELYPDEEPLGTCPCERKLPVYERSWFYRCKQDPDTPAEEDCEFRLWKDKAGRYMDRASVQLLLEKGETPPLDGFLTRDGRGYGGSLKLEGKDLKLTPLSDGEGERTSDQPEYEVNDAPMGTCPACKEGKILETPTHYRCSMGAEQEGKQPCLFVLPRTVCRREITREEAEAYVRDSRTAMLEEFISRYGRPFSAVLFLKPNGRHGFEFAPRPARKKGAGGSPSRKRPTRGSGRKKGTGKKAARKKTTRKKAARKRPATSRKKGTTKRTSSSTTRRSRTEGD